FFQAEDGIRDFHVTGVQTCALPISRHQLVAAFVGAALAGIMYLLYELAKKLPAPLSSVFQDLGLWHVHFAGSFMQGVFSLKDARSEERRVGKGRRLRCS